MLFITTAQSDKQGGKWQTDEVESGNAGFSISYLVAMAEVFEATKKYRIHTKMWIFCKYFAKCALVIVFQPLPHFL